MFDNHHHQHHHHHLSPKRRNRTMHSTSLIICIFVVVAIVLSSSLLVVQCHRTQVTTTRSESTTTTTSFTKYDRLRSRVQQQQYQQQNQQQRGGRQLQMETSKTGATMIQLDGSGTISPMKCFWDIMAKMESASSVPLRLTYRGVGTQQGSNEFLTTILSTLQNTNINATSRITESSSFPVFTAVDHPISTVQYNDINEKFQTDLAVNTSVLVQIPILASAISFYHSVLSKKGIALMFGDVTGFTSTGADDSNTTDPTYSDGGWDEAVNNTDDDMNFGSTTNGGMLPYMPGGDDTVIVPLALQLDPCIIAKIYTGAIQYWDDQEIISSNEGNGKVSKQLPHLPIRVFALKDDSSTNLAVTKYLRQACPSVFSLNYVIPSPYFGNPNVTIVTSPEELLNELRAQPGSIGYLEVREDLINDDNTLEDSVSEVQLLITDTPTKRYYTSTDVALAYRGISVALPRTKFPDTPDGDYNNTQFFITDPTTTASTDQPDGELSWPIVVVTFLMIPKDLSTLIPNKIERSLLYAFLETFYMEDFVGVCRDRYSFTVLPDPIQEFAKVGIDLLRNYPANAYAPDSEQWKFELKNSTTSAALEHPYVLSLKRKDYAAYVRNDLSSKISDLQYVTTDLITAMDEMEKEIFKVSGGKDLSTDDDRTGGNNGNSNNGKDSVNDLPLSDDDVLNKMSAQDQLDILSFFEQQITTALALASVSFGLWMIVLLYYFIRFALRFYRRYIRNEKDDNYMMDAEKNNGNDGAAIGDDLVFTSTTTDSKEYRTSPTTIDQTDDDFEEVSDYNNHNNNNNNNGNHNGNNNNNSVASSMNTSTDDSYDSTIVTKSSSSSSSSLSPTGSLKKKRLPGKSRGLNASKNNASDNFRIL